MIITIGEKSIDRDNKLCLVWIIIYITAIARSSIVDFFLYSHPQTIARCSKEVDGGFLHVEHGSTARFLEDLNVTNFRTVCTRDGDYCGEMFEGGCVWNEVIIPPFYVLCRMP